MSNIPSNEQIRTALDNAYAYAKTVQGGKNASYIPALAQVPSDLLAIAVVTVNGDLLTAGSADAPFAIESISKAFNLAYVMDLIGMKQLRAKIGADPTGEPFNSVMAIELHGGKPLNPLVNAGAMATVSLVNGSDSDEIWGNMIHNFNNFANTALTVNQEIYKSESATNQHNRGIAWLLDSYGYFYNTPPMIGFVHPHVFPEHHRVPAGPDGRLLRQRRGQSRQQEACGERGERSPHFGGNVHVRPL